LTDEAPSTVLFPPLTGPLALEFAIVEPARLDPAKPAATLMPLAQASPEQPSPTVTATLAFERILNDGCDWTHRRGPLLPRRAA
jgi:hypothetical protein